MKLKHGGRTLIVALTALLLTLVASVVAVAPAQAGTCATRGCGGRVINRSTMNVRIQNCWSGVAQIVFKDKHDCVKYPNNWYQKNADAELPPGGDSDWTTTFYYDVDGFRAYKGCITQYYWGSDSGNIQTEQPGGTSMWIKFSDPLTVTITSIRC
ncbi:hypothetical protein HH310_22605 [Actinoplanes sp. TBRC 11911]|uniref:hypothetical protein n=1 Tax=Actinoplanes sp. TBRC 11911 TaxID=2729386 RepID=UPI00145D04F5|nr:hypothetical protein [Actinoplanes sp. TBRC 11911]NMO53959.1 hypothetical protein [Actinoplanes sp. TBRC 11911]